MEAVKSVLSPLGRALAGLPVVVGVGIVVAGRWRGPGRWVHGQVPESKVMTVPVGSCPRQAGSVRGGDGHQLAARQTRPGGLPAVAVPARRSQACVYRGGAWLDASRR